MFWEESNCRTRGRNALHRATLEPSRLPMDFTETLNDFGRAKKYRDEEVI